MAFLVDAHCSVGDVRQCRKYSRASEGGASKVHGASTTARATKHLFEDNDARPTTSVIRSGGILAIAHPTFAKGIRRSSHYMVIGVSPEDDGSSQATEPEGV